MKLMVGGILAATVVILIAVFSFNASSADNCRVVVDRNIDGTVYNAAIRFEKEHWGEMSEYEKALVLDKCIKEVEKQNPAKQYVIYAKNQQTGELVFTNDSVKGLVEVGKYVTDKGIEEEER